MDTPPKSTLTSFYSPSLKPIRKVLTLEAVEELAYANGKDKNEAAIALLEKGALPSVIKRLEVAGIRGISDYIQHGDFAIVLQANQHQMIRIVKADSKGEQKRTLKPYMLQPLATIDDVPGFRIEVLPKVECYHYLLWGNAETLRDYFTQKPDEDDYTFGRRAKKELGSIVEHLIITILRDHKLPDDMSNYNIAILHNGDHPIAVLLDPGTIRSDFDINAIHHIKHIEKLSTGFQMPWVEKYLPKYAWQAHSFDENCDRKTRKFLSTALSQPNDLRLYEDAHKAHLAWLGLKEGQINGVVSENDLSRLYSDKPRTGTYVEMVEKKRLYKPQIAKKVQENLKNGTGLCGRVKAERQADDANRTTGI